MTNGKKLEDITTSPLCGVSLIAVDRPSQRTWSAFLFTLSGGVVQTVVVVELKRVGDALKYDITQRLADLLSEDPRGKPFPGQKS